MQTVGTSDPICNENPWIREHSVQGDILYPSAGIVFIAIEAARRPAEENPKEEVYSYNADRTSKAAKYCFADISPGFVAKAADCFSAGASITECAALNIKCDPAEQAFSLKRYNLTICTNVRHATRSIQETFIHCTSLLKPGSHLMLSEVTIKRIFSGFTMGSLPGRWLGKDDGRSGGRLQVADERSAALTKAGSVSWQKLARTFHSEAIRVVRS
ncbi:hypothetical protein H9Q70_010244 [Fusarium xylarioides]|nr:hypothetical protein H9Q70_010244 [Fusarium xylarioides]KAG5777315.1 hypothetical protein H9Q73_009020 [Fusarium xylarioides]